MTVTIRDLGDFVIYLGGVAAALAAMGVLARYVVLRPLKRWVGEQITALLQGTQAVQETAEEVRNEVKNNGGNSLKDAVTRTEYKMNELTRRFDDHLVNHGRTREDPHGH
ncbi:hypothetical protein ACWEN6_13470 [Sphaerisporangium sp. NPDC004334]